MARSARPLPPAAATPADEILARLDAATAALAGEIALLRGHTAEILARVARIEASREQSLLWGWPAISAAIGRCERSLRRDMSYGAPIGKRGGRVWCHLPTYVLWLLEVDRKRLDGRIPPYVRRRTASVATEPPAA